MTPASPKTRLMRHGMIHWAALLPALPAGDYVIRSRTIDDKGIRGRLASSASLLSTTVQKRPKPYTVAEFGRFAKFTDIRHCLAKCVALATNWLQIYVPRFCVYSLLAAHG